MARHRLTRRVRRRLTRRSGASDTTARLRLARRSGTVRHDGPAPSDRHRPARRVGSRADRPGTHGHPLVPGRHPTGPADDLAGPGYMVTGADHTYETYAITFPGRPDRRVRGVRTLTTTEHRRRQRRGRRHRHRHQRHQLREHDPGLGSTPPSCGRAIPSTCRAGGRDGSWTPAAPDERLERPAHRGGVGARVLHRPRNLRRPARCRHRATTRGVRATTITRGYTRELFGEQLRQRCQPLLDRAVFRYQAVVIEAH
jgi:hypothetical protein